MKNWLKAMIGFALSTTLFCKSASAVDTFQGLDFVTRVNDYPNDKYSAIWGYTSPEGKEYALLAVRTGTAIYDVTDTKSIKKIAFIPGVKSIWRELKVFKSYAYVVVDQAADKGIQIIDLSKLPERAELVNTYTKLPNSHTLWIDEATEVLYTSGGSGNAVVALSLKDPVNLTEISRFGSTYVHDMFAINGKAFLAEIMSKSWSIFDVSDITKPSLVKRVRDPQAPSISFHNAWPTEDGKTLITTEETSGRTVKFWDITDITNPKLISEWLGAGRLAHNVRVKGKYAYIAHYGGGIRILDISDVRKPTEVAFWQRNAEAESGFVSIWDAYPYFKSGTIIGSDMEYGLIVLKFDGAREN